MSLNIPYLYELGNALEELSKFKRSPIQPPRLDSMETGR
jgi:hypothetical protein